MANVRIEVNGQSFERWTALSVRVSFSEMTRGFALEYFDELLVFGASFPINTDDEIKIYFDDTLILTGYVDYRARTLNGDSYTCSAQGRGKCGDLIDCAAFLEQPSWKNADAITIIEQICEPFAIDVSDETYDAPTLQEFTLDLGETCNSAINRICRSIGSVAFEGGDGSLRVIKSPAFGLVALPEASGVTEDSDTSGVFSDYTVDATIKGRKGHRKAKTHTRVTVTEPSATRYRPTLIQADGPGTEDFAARRASAERSYSVGQSLIQSLVMPGWEDLTGELIEAGYFVQFVYPPFEINALRFMNSVDYAVRGDGQTCVVELISDKAYTPSELELLG